MSESRGFHFLNKKEESRSTLEDLPDYSEVISDERKFILSWLSFTKNFYAPYSRNRKIAYFLPLASKRESFPNIIVVPEDYPENVIPRKQDRYKHYNLLVQFYEKTKDDTVLETIKEWKEYLFVRLPPIPTPRLPKPKPRNVSNIISWMMNEESAEMKHFIPYINVIN